MLRLARGGIRNGGLAATSRTRISPPLVPQQRRSLTTQELNELDGKVIALVSVASGSESLFIWVPYAESTTGTTNSEQSGLGMVPYHEIETNFDIKFIMHQKAKDSDIFCMEWMTKRGYYWEQSTQSGNNLERRKAGVPPFDRAHSCLKVGGNSYNEMTFRSTLSGREQEYLVNRGGADGYACFNKNPSGGLEKWALKVSGGDPQVEDVWTLLEGVDIEDLGGGELRFMWSQTTGISHSTEEVKTQFEEISTSMSTSFSYGWVSAEAGISVTNGSEWSQASSETFDEQVTRELEYTTGPDFEGEGAYIWQLVGHTGELQAKSNRIAFTTTKTPPGDGDGQPVETFAMQRTQPKRI